MMYPPLLYPYCTSDLLQALQTTDMPLLCHALSAILQVRHPSLSCCCAEPPLNTCNALFQRGISGAPTAASIAVASGAHLSFPPSRALASVGLRFLLPLSRLMEGMHERKVVTEVLRHGIFELAVRYVDARGAAEADPGDLLCGLEGLAGMAASEEFVTQKVRRSGARLRSPRQRRAHPSHRRHCPQAKALPSPEGVAACARLKDALLDRVTADDLPLRRKLRPLIDLSIEFGRKAKK